MEGRYHKTTNEFSEEFEKLSWTYCNQQNIQFCISDLTKTVNFGKVISNLQKRITIVTCKKLENLSLQRLSQGKEFKFCWYNKPFLRYLWMTSAVGMAFYLTLKAKTTHKNMMVSTKCSILKQLTEDDSIWPDSDLKGIMNFF